MVGLLAWLVLSDSLVLQVSAMSTSYHHDKKHHSHGPKHTKKPVGHKAPKKHGKAHHHAGHTQTEAHASKHAHTPATLTAIQEAGQADDPPTARLQQEEEEDFGTTGAGDEQQSKPGPPPPPPSPVSQQAAVIAAAVGQNATTGGDSAAASLWQEDVKYYGPCLRDYRKLTLKENCPHFDDKAGGVTLFFSHCVDDEMTMLNMGYIAGQARKNIVQHGVGADVDKVAASSQVRHMLQKSKARVAFKCAPKSSDCARQSVDQSDVPAALGQDRLCPAKALGMVPLSGGDDAAMWAAMRTRAKDVARGYRDVPEPAVAFEGGSAGWGAALAVCHHMSLVGKGGPHEDGVIPDAAFTSAGMYEPPPAAAGGSRPPASLEEEGGVTGTKFTTWLIVKSNGYAWEFNAGQFVGVYDDNMPDRLDRKVKVGVDGVITGAEQDVPAEASCDAASGFRCSIESKTNPKSPADDMKPLFPSSSFFDRTSSKQIIKFEYNGVFERHLESASKTFVKGEVTGKVGEYELPKPNDIYTPMRLVSMIYRMAYYKRVEDRGLLTKATEECISDAIVLYSDKTRANWDSGVKEHLKTKKYVAPIIEGNLGEERWARAGYREDCGFSPALTRDSETKTTKVTCGGPVYWDKECKEKVNWDSYAKLPFQEQVEKLTNDLLVFVSSLCQGTGFSQTVLEEEPCQDLDLSYLSSLVGHLRMAKQIQ